MKRDSANSGHSPNNPGNGCVNDFSRTLAAHAWAPPLIPASAITIFSGGTEGVLSPHVTLIVREARDLDDQFLPAEPRGVATGLVALVGRTRALRPHEIGTAAQVEQVRLVLEGCWLGSRKSRVS